MNIEQLNSMCNDRDYDLRCTSGLWTGCLVAISQRPEGRGEGRAKSGHTHTLPIPGSQSPAPPPPPPEPGPDLKE